jgi:hypothetical protein
VPRYIVSGPAAAAQALLSLVSLARTSPDDFEFGPVDLNDIVNVGLTVDGAEALVSKTLGDVEGVALADSVAPDG